MPAGMAGSTMGTSVWRPPDLDPYQPVLCGQVTARGCQGRDRQCAPSGARPRQSLLPQHSRRICDLRQRYGRGRPIVLSARAGGGYGHVDPTVQPGQLVVRSQWRELCSVRCAAGTRKTRATQHQAGEDSALFKHRASAFATVAKRRTPTSTPTRESAPHAAVSVGRAIRTLASRRVPLRRTVTPAPAPDLMMSRLPGGCSRTYGWCRSPAA